MTQIERAQMWHLTRRWHKFADDLHRDEMYFGLLFSDMLAVAGDDQAPHYRGDGSRRSLDS